MPFFSFLCFFPCTIFLVHSVLVSHVPLPQGHVGTRLLNFFGPGQASWAHFSPYIFLHPFRFSFFRDGVAVCSPILFIFFSLKRARHAGSFDPARMSVRRVCDEFRIFFVSHFKSSPKLGFSASIFVSCSHFGACDFGV
jgi:hypothetical protein